MNDQDKGKETMDNKTDQKSSEMKKKFSFPSMNYNTPSEAAKDPLKILTEIAKDKDIEAETKEWLLNYSVTRFNNRRKMAYLSLITIIAFVGFLALAAVYDGLISANASEGILANVKKVESLFIWIGGFLASIVATYYGVSSFRPSS
ncbi:MAG: hypothetical protein KAR45_16765 [Desulfobacteraceae bacterium]|nr:hypothetical protein [Desulfobacteraceae bacterium]